MVDLFRTVISAGKLEALLTEVGSRFSATSYIGIGKDEYREHEALLSPLGFKWNEEGNLYLIAWREELENLLARETSATFDVFTRKPYRPDQRDRFDSIQYWYWEHWKFFRSEVKSSIIKGIVVFLSLFETDPDVRRVSVRRRNSTRASHASLIQMASFSGRSRNSSNPAQLLA